MAVTPRRRIVKGLALPQVAQRAQQSEARAQWSAQRSPHAVPAFDTTPVRGWLISCAIDAVISPTSMIR
jgi:hypothetical protein